MQRTHLPVYGVGPICVAVMLFFFLAFGLFECLGSLNSGKAHLPHVLFWGVGCLLIVLGIWIWIQAVIVAKINCAILENHLVTDGIYSWVRNPIYSAIAMALSGFAMLSANLWALLLPCIFWADITILMKSTEEKWLAECYGQEYLDYCSKVNRCIPWFPKQ